MMAYTLSELTSDLNGESSFTLSDLIKGKQREGTTLDKIASVVESAKDAMSARNGAGGAIAQAIGRGAASLGYPQLERYLQNYNQQEDARIQTLRDRAGFSGTDVTKAAFTAANPSNVVTMPMFGGPAASLVGRMAQGAGIAGTQSLLSPVKDPTQDYLSQKGTNALGAAVLGGVGVPVAEGVVKGIGALASPIVSAFRKSQSDTSLDAILSMRLGAEGVDFSKLSDGIKTSLRSQAKEALSGGGALNLSPEMVQRAADFERLGVGGLKGQITRDPVQWSWEMNKRGVIDDLAQRFNEQERALTGKLQNFQQTAGPTMTPFDAGKSIIESLQRHDNNLSMKITGAYNKARESTGSIVPVDMTPIAQRLGETIDTFGAENIPSAVMSKLNSYGLMGGKQTKVFDLLEADKLLKTINAHYDQFKPTQVAALGNLRRGLTEAVDSVQVPEGNATADLFREAVGLAKERFNLIDKTDGLKSAIRGSTNPEDFVRKFVENGSVSDLENLMKILPPDTAQAVRRQLVDRIAGRAFNKETDATLQSLSHAGLKNSQASITLDRLERVLTPQQLDELNFMTRISGAMQVSPPGNYVNRSNTAVEAMRSALGGLSRIPGAPLLLKGVDMAQNVARTRGALNPGEYPFVEPLSPELRGLLAKQLGLAGGVATAGLLSE